MADRRSERGERPVLATPRIPYRRLAAHAAALQEGVRLYQTVFDRSALGQLVVSFPSFRIDVVNRACCAMTGFTVEELAGSDVAIIFTPGQNPVAETLDRLADGDTDSYTAQSHLRRADGTVLPVQSTVSVISDDDGRPVQLLVVFQDRNQQRRAEDTQRRSQVLIDAAIAALPMTFTAFDTNLHVTYVAGGMERRGNEPRDFLGQHVTAFTRHGPTLQALRQALKGTESTTRTSVNGQTYLTLHGPIRDDGGNIAGVISVSTNVTTEATAAAARRQAEELRLYVAQHDSLTGLPGRAALIEHLNTLAWSTRGPGALLVVDIDGFRVINDGLGQEVGDAMLVEVANRISAAFPGLMVARKGGDEFAVVFTADVSREDALRAAEQARSAFEADIHVASHALRLTAGVGIAIRQLLGSSSTLIADADAALSSAKEDGPGQYRLFDRAMRRSMEERLTLQSGLRIALRTGNLQVVYQPIVRLAERSVVGAEALVRWTNPERGPIPPSEFIPIAEQCGLIGAIGELVMTTACSDLAPWHRTHGLEVAVNVSVRQLVDGRFADWVERVLEKSGLPPAALTIEVTESALMEDIGSIRAAFDQLRSRGARVAIDDFGTGYSSLARLQRLPVDIVKLDRAFVSGVDSRPQARRMATAILQVSEAIGADIVAEGIETEAEASTLLELGYRHGQGFLFARPLPLAELGDHLRLHATSSHATAIEAARANLHPGQRDSGAA